MTKELIEAKIKRAEQGREIWLNLKRECELTENTFVILFPQEDTACNAYVMKYLEDFAVRTNADRLVLLAYDKEVLDLENGVGSAWQTSFKNKVKTRFVSREDALQIMDYYTLQMFTDRLIIASLDEPEGRNGSNIIGINDITEEEAVAIGILGLVGIR